MYKDQIHDVIMKRMLDRVGAKYDKREGSIIWDSLAPVAVELQNFFYALSAVLDEIFPDTATRKYLIKHCAEIGMEPKKATNATFYGTCTPLTCEVPIGSRFSLEDYNYIVRERLGDGEYKFECETAGSVPNGLLGRLIPIGYIQNLETATLTEIITPGDDEEDTEALRSRYLMSRQKESFGGNEQDYRTKVLEMDGVSACKVYSGSKWNGGGTVLVVIQGSDYKEPSYDVVDSVQYKLDPESVIINEEISTDNSVARSTVENTIKMGIGEGKGLAPIGHFVSVIPVKARPITIQTEIRYSNGYTWGNLQDEIRKSVQSYIDSLNSRWQNNDYIVVRISHIESAILDVNGVLDVQNTKLNNELSNLALLENEIIGEVTVNGY